MIHAKAPLRISFSGGGSDHPSFYHTHGGCVLSVAIKKYAHATITKPNLTTSEVTSMHYWTDLPPGSGLGGSSAVAVACIAAEDRRHGIERSKADTVAAAEALERGHLRMAGGSQDYYPAVYGGCNLIEFFKQESGCNDPRVVGTNRGNDGGLTHWSSGVEGVRRVSPIDAGDLSKWLLLVRTGDRAHKELAKQKDVDIREDANVQAALVEMMQLTKDMYAALTIKEYEVFGRLLDDAWVLKKESSPHCTTERAGAMLRKATKAGALGGKLCGCGGGGYLLLCAAPDTHPKIKAALEPMDCMCEAVEFDQEGLMVEGQL